jgi:hypothetical protein
VVLYRPVGEQELNLIRQSMWRRFPPRLPEQPIFYPVVQRDYATRIARDWNTKGGGKGFVTRFNVDEDYLKEFEVHTAGGDRFTEYWIPAERLNEFNAHLVGAIEAIEEFPGPDVPNGWVNAYDLRQDDETVKLVQHATLTTEGFGLEPEIALYGSEEWWNAVNEGRIPKQEALGVISRVYMSGHGDWPEFEMTCGDEKTQWTRFGDGSLYEVGKRVRVEYVLQKFRRPVMGQLEHKEVIRILVERSFSSSP